MCEILTNVHHLGQKNYELDNNSQKSEQPNEKQWRRGQDPLRISEGCWNWRNVFTSHRRASEHTTSNLEERRNVKLCSARGISLYLLLFVTSLFIHVRSANAIFDKRRRTRRSRCPAVRRWSKRSCANSGRTCAGCARTSRDHTLRASPFFGFSYRTLQLLASRQIGKIAKLLWQILAKFR